MIDDETEEELRYGQTLPAHVIPSGDMVAVLKRLVHEGVMSIEKRSSAPRLPRRDERRSLGEPAHPDRRAA